MSKDRARLPALRRSARKRRATLHLAGKELTLPTAPEAAAAVAGLRYVNDPEPGLRRIRRGKGFGYRHPDDRRVTDRAMLRRIRALAIPPAWTDVWICRDPDGHIQAVGRDDRGRKQYRYHPQWRTVRDATKYHRMILFAEALPTIRARTDADLALPGLPRDKVLATVVRLLEETGIRVGNDEYAKENQSFGLTTLRNRHVEVNGSTIRFEFRGKSGVYHSVDVSDRRLARIVKRCQDLPGHELFQYLDAEGARRTVDSRDVNDYLRGLTGQDFTAKDFRTWIGTVLAARALLGYPAFTSATEAKRYVVRAVEKVAAQLRNTRAVCRKCYIHPELITSYLAGELVAALAGGTAAEGLSKEESALLAFLKARLKTELKEADGDTATALLSAEAANPLRAG